MLSEGKHRAFGWVVGAFSVHYEVEQLGICLLLQLCLFHLTQVLWVHRIDIVALLPKSAIGNHLHHLVPLGFRAS